METMYDRDPGERVGRSLKLRDLGGRRRSEAIARLAGYRSRLSGYRLTGNSGEPG